MLMRREIRIGFHLKQNNRLPRSVSIVPVTTATFLISMDDQPPFMTRRKVPSSPREFFAKIYGSGPTDSKSTVETPPLRETLESSEIQLGINSLLWPPTMAAAAQFHWNLVHNLSNGGNEERRQETDGGTPSAVQFAHFHLPPALNSFCKCIQLFLLTLN